MNHPYPDQKARLQALYRRNNLAVACIDESYQLPNDPSREPFYILVAVIVQKNLIESVRKHLDDLVCAPKWHTTSDMRNLKGSETANKIRKLTGDRCKVLVSRANSFSLGDKNGEITRAKLLQELLIRIAGESPKVGLAVLEKRPAGYLAARDKATISVLRSQKKFPDHLRILAASPADEHLLWLPDVFAWFERRLK